MKRDATIMVLLYSNDIRTCGIFADIFCAKVDKITLKTKYIVFVKKLFIFA